MRQLAIAHALALGAVGLLITPGAHAAEPDGLIGVSTPPHAELRETVPIAPSAGRKTRTVLSLDLPRLKRGDRIRFRGEVAITMTCVEPGPRCIGRRYGFDPHLRAQIVLAGRQQQPVSRRVSLTCEQTRPNRNHHCPLVFAKGATSVERLRRLPCHPDDCRLSMALDAYHHKARGGEVVVVGADRPNGTVAGGKARLSAAIARDGAGVESAEGDTSQRRSRKLAASFSGGWRVTYSQRLNNLRAGDVLLMRALQRTAIQRYPYFVATRIIVATRSGARNPGRLTRRIVSRDGTATEVNGFNCTLGPSAFRDPCSSRKAGLAELRRTPLDDQGQPRPLYVNLVARAFPKLSQAKHGSYPPARVLPGGSLTVERLRADPGGP